MQQSKAIYALTLLLSLSCAYSVLAEPIGPYTERAIDIFQSSDFIGVVRAVDESQDGGQAAESRNVIGVDIIRCIKGEQGKFASIISSDQKDSIKVGKSYLVFAIKAFKKTDMQKYTRKLGNALYSVVADDQRVFEVIGTSDDAEWKAENFKIVINRRSFILNNVGMKRRINVKDYIFDNDGIRAWVDLIDVVDSYSDCCESK